MEPESAHAAQALAPVRAASAGPRTERRSPPHDPAGPRTPEGGRAP